MANEIKVNIAATDNGSIAQVTNSAKKLNSELEKAKKNASGLRPAGQTAAVSGANTDIEANRLAKGISGASGAAGRDFAKQAQGLGGLVHVYATFAANLFAVTAGFQALSKAADYTNMVKGLDQLGAASGKNLGTMAKNVAALTDGAVSLKEAMGAVAQASSAGMNGDQIERMALVAKKASQALGRDMGDSLNRISRGITKLEPELLDEIGIFIRVDKAASDYALSIGKTANSLTDFEKRQAFANAALKQAEDKFGKINLDANPFSKLQASFIDLLYKGGELLNKVLGPLASILASSPVALGTAMAGVVGMLLKQAIPAMSQWRSGLLDAADAAEKVAKRTAEAHQHYKIGKEVEAGKAILAPMEAQMTSSINSIQSKLQEALPKTSKLLTNALSDNYNPEKEAAKYTTAYKRIQKEAEVLEKAKAQMTKEQIALADKELAKKSESIKLLKEAQKEAVNYAGVQKAYFAQQNTLDAQSGKAGLFERMLGSNAARAASKASSARILADVGINTQEMGPIDAFKKMMSDIGEAKTDKKLGSIRAGFTAISGAARIAGAALMTVVSALSSVFMIVGVLTVAFQLLDGVFSKNSKQLEEYSGALEASNEASLGLARTTDYLRDNNISSAFSTEGVTAFANALEEVSNKLLKVEKTFRAVKENESTWDTLKNNVLDLVNMDVERKAAETYANNIYQVLQSTTDPKQYEELLNTIKYNIGSDAEGLSKKGLIEGLDKLFNEGKLSKVGAITDKIEEQSKSFKKASVVLQGYKTSVEAASKSMQTLSNSFIPSDNMSKFGIDQMNAAKELAKALEDPKTAIAALAETVNNFDAMKIMPPELQDSLLKATPRIAALQQEVSGIENALLKYKKLKEEVLGQKTIEEYDGTEDAGTAAQNGRRTVKAEDSLVYRGIVEAEKTLSTSMREKLQESAEISKEFAGSSIAIFEDGYAKISQALKAELEKAAIGYSKTISSQFKGPEATKVQTDLQIQEIAVQQKIIDSQMGVLLSQEKLRIAMEANTIEQAIMNAKSQVDSQEKTNTLAKLDKSKKANEAQGIFLQGKSVSSLRDAFKSDRGMASQFSSLLANIDGAANQKASLELQKKGVKLTGAIKQEYDRLDIEKERISNEQKKLDTKSQEVDRELSYGYTEALSAEKEKLSIQSDALKVDEAQAALDTLKLKHTIALNAEKANGGKNYADLSKEASREETAAETSLQALKDSNIEKQKKASDEKNARDREHAQFLFDIEMRKQEAVKTTADIVSGMYKSSIDKQVSAGIVTKGAGIQGQASLDIEVQQREYEITSAKKLQELRNAEKIAASSKSADNDLRVEALKAESAEIDKQNILKQSMIKIEANYQAALVKTEETLKRIETTGGSVTDYAGAMYQDFSNKVSDLVKNTKSAASAFNEGFIQAIDTSIDKFFEMMQTGTLNMKDMVKFVRNSLSDVFRDYAANTIKNTWKSLMAQVLPPSDEIKAAREQVSATNRLIKALEDNTASKNGSTGGSIGYSPSGGTTTSAGGDISQENYDILKNMDVSGSSEDIKDASTVQKTASKGFFDSAIGFGKGVYDFITGADRSTTGMSKIIENFGNMMPSLFTGIYGAISSAMSMSSSGSDGGGIFGTILKAGIGYLTGGWSGVATSLISSVDGPWTSTNPVVDSQAGIEVRDLVTQAKGGVWHGSASLSAHSNSIVDSPTLFAFAKGAGLMGEAGPEAIMPLKRDSQGNLGIRGGSGDTNNNNISINITVEGGTAKDSGGDRSTQNAMASQLGAAIKAAVSDELIKQSRPGGLLARR